MNAKIALSQIIKLQRKFLEEIGTRFVFATDELYYMAGMPFPRAAHYEQFPYIIDGVGVAAKLIKEFEAALRDVTLPEEAMQKTVISGTVHGRAIEELIERLPYKTLDLWMVDNKFLGNDASVAEMFAGQDVIDMLSGRDIGELLLVHRHNLYEGDVFVDKLTVETVGKELGVQVKIFENGADLLEKLLY
jgi:NifB/MoaA-like Fe-S oxidoreductase